MKRAVCAWIVVLICAGAVYAFEREVSDLPIIGEPFAAIECAVEVAYFCGGVLENACVTNTQLTKWQPNPYCKGFNV